MKPGEASATAMGAALMRAAHLLIDGDPKIHIDPYAVQFLDEGRRSSIESNPMLRQPNVVASRGHIVGRHALTEELLVRAIDNGVRQYVVLGAGYDSSALRLAGALAECTTYEVDHPDTQASKRDALAGIEWPTNVRFVPVDFEIDSLGEKLRAAGWREDQRSFWSWMGVTMYLTDVAVFETLRFVASGAPGSVIAVGYTIHDDDIEESDRLLRDQSGAGVARSGEPWVNHYHPREFAARVAALGFSTVRNVSPAEFQARYFRDRTDGLWFSSLTAVLVATV